MDYAERARWAFSGVAFAFNRAGDNVGSWGFKDGDPLPWRYQNPTTDLTEGLLAGTMTGRFPAWNRAANARWSAKQVSAGLGIPREYLGFPPEEPAFPMTVFDNMAKGFPMRGLPLCLEGLRC